MSGSHWSVVLLAAVGLSLGLPRQGSAMRRETPAASAYFASASAAQAGAPGVFDGALLRLRSPLSPMVRIPAGEFVMGSNEDDILAALADCAREPFGNRCEPSFFADELPRRIVQLSSYWLDRFEVRVADYERCVELGRCRARPTSEGMQRFLAPDLPASVVSWDDARAYCEFRGARLPTEAEFERAARGLTARRYPWGELWNRRIANHGRRGWDSTDDTDGFAELAPVGSFPAGATPEGVYDLAGNVAEWIQDRYLARYDANELRDPQGPGVGTASVRVVRGGNYRTDRTLLRGAARASAEPSERTPLIGFRCARSERQP